MLYTEVLERLENTARKLSQNVQDDDGEDESDSEDQNDERINLETLCFLVEDLQH